MMFLVWKHEIDLTRYPTRIVYNVLLSSTHSILAAVLIALHTAQVCSTIVFDAVCHWIALRHKLDSSSSRYCNRFLLTFGSAIFS